MPSSDALVVGEDWISEHFFTTDSTKESFHARVFARRKEWDAEAAEDRPTTRSRFLAVRGDLERRLVALDEATAATDGATGTEAADGEYADNAAARIEAKRGLDAILLDVLGYRTGELVVREEGPIAWVSPHGLAAAPPLAVLAAAPVATAEELLDKHAHTLLTPWLPMDRHGAHPDHAGRPDDPAKKDDPLVSASAALSRLMTEAHGPSYALVLAGRWCLVAEKERWPEGRWLAVDLQLVCERNDATRGGEIDRALTCLDAASLAPDAAGTTWWTQTLEASVKHTVGVSKDLQDGVRRSIETIANEVLDRRRARGLPELPPEKAQKLAVQALRYLYRILFLLYAEASPELGVLPVGAQEYDAGYGLDRLRDLALRQVVTPRAQQGTHLYESLQRLFVLVDSGHEPVGAQDLPEGLTFGGLRADLFRPAATELIDEVGLGNAALLAVLQRLLLTKESAKEQRGYISYVDLGINQLGAVYEGLMSYTGSFATEDLYEVAPDGDPSGGSWVVPVSRAEHLAKKDFVREPHPETGEMIAKVHDRGSFVFRLSGRDRQRSASYYTPEVLTRFTVQQALAELLDQDGRRTSAEEILGLSVCEPALGSGAFAIEAVRQLAEEYLTRREAELDERVEPDQRPRELQRVKAYLALHRVYGVDLNATAVELAEVSLWLDTMVQGLAAPWFGLRLRRGNSLVGARRATYPVALFKGKGRDWLTTPPDPQPLSGLAARLDTPDDGASGTGAATLGDQGIHHFLLPAQGWGAAVEVPKSVRDLVPDQTLKDLKAWRSAIRSKPSTAQLKTLDGLARRTERLWEFALRRLRIAEAESSRRIDLWGRDTIEPAQTVSREQIEASLADPDGAYRRLRLVMDAWCALWYWPLTPTDGSHPPKLDQWLAALTAILGVERPDKKRDWMTTFARAPGWAELGEAEQLDLAFAGAQPIELVRREHPWLGVCEKVAAEQGFFHWELDFATVFAAGGFDLQVGNPPWVRPNVEVESLLAEGDPWWALALKPSEAEKAQRRPETMRMGGMWKLLVDACAETSVLGDVLGDSTLYPVLTGRPDLYRAFMSQVWDHAAPRGISGLIHMETHFTDDKAEALRTETYRRLRRHWQFVNELTLFDIHHLVRFGVNTYGSRGEVDFLHATGLYHPDTIIRSLSHDGSGQEPGFKDAASGWDLRPHRGRIQRIDREGLRLWSDVLGGDAWAKTQMVYTVNAAAARTLATLASSTRIRALALSFSAGWNETTDRQAGRFVSLWGPSSWSDAILQGPHLHVATPLYKAPNESMKHNQDWTATDFESLGIDAVPVTAYKPAGDRYAYDAAYTHWGDDRVPARDHYRVAWRRMAANTGERTLISALIPPGAAHVFGINSGADISQPVVTVVVAGVLSSLLSDFSIRSAPKGDILPGTLSRLAMVSLDHPLIGALVLRTLRLNCVTDAYADLWAQCWDDAFLSDAPILPRHDERPIGPQWSGDTPLRRAVDRRNAQVEIDALVALMLGVPVEELCTIYRTQFAVLYGYDHRDYTYDRNGRLIPNSVLAAWRKLGEANGPDAASRMPAADRTVIHPGSGVAYTYEFPFGLLDREDDFRTAYQAFEARLAAITGEPDQVC